MQGVVVLATCTSLAGVFLKGFTLCTPNQGSPSFLQLSQCSAFGSWGLSKASHGQQSEDTQVETLVVSFEHTSFSRHSGYFHRGELLPLVAITFSTVHSLSCFFFLLLCSCFHIITLLLVYIHIHKHWVWSLHHGPSSHSRIYTCMCPSWGPAISWHAI